MMKLLGIIVRSQAWNVYILLGKYLLDEDDIFQVS